MRQNRTYNEKTFLSRILQVYKQKVKYLIYEHKKDVEALKAEGVVSLKLVREENQLGEVELRKEKRDLKVQIKELQLSHQDEIKGLRMVRSGMCNWLLINVLI